MTSNGYWVNNELIVWKNAIKPCKLCGFCPYGQLVEEFPVPSPSKKEALDHHEYMIKALAAGTFDNPDPDNPFLMTREMAQAEIDEFDINDYVDDSVPIDKMRCGVFGHHCPVYYHAELMAEDDPVTKEEIAAFELEMNEYFKKVEEYYKKKEADE